MYLFFRVNHGILSITNSFLISNFAIVFVFLVEEKLEIIYCDMIKGKVCLVTTQSK